MASDRRAEALLQPIADEWNDAIRTQRRDMPEGHQRRMAAAVSAFLASPAGLRVLTETLPLVEDRVDLRVIYGYEVGYRDAANEIAAKIEGLPVCVACYVEGQPCDVKDSALEIARSVGASETGDTTGKQQMLAGAVDRLKDELRPDDPDEIRRRLGDTREKTT